MLVPNRHGSSDNYRYGFNGMEKDDELKGVSNSYDYGKRFYDPRVGRFLSLDPLASNFAYESNYNYVSNNPIIYSDPTGGAKIIRFIITDRTTGKTYAAIAVVVDEWDIAKGNTIHNYPFAKSGTPETTYEWHDINITQNVMREPDGSYTMVGEPIKDNGKQVLATQPWKWAAKGEIIARRIDANLPGEGEAAIFKWLEGDGEECDNCGGIMFYSKKGEGTGVRGTNKKIISYENGDELLDFVKAGTGIASGMPNNVGQEGPLPFGKGGWKGKVSPELQKLFDQTKKIYDNLKTAESAVEKPAKIIDEAGKLIPKASDSIKHNDNWIPWGKNEDDKFPDDNKED